MNLAVGIAAIIVCALIGIVKSQALSGRVEELEEVLVMVEKMQTCLEYEKMPTGELIERLSRQENLKHLCFLKECSEMMKDSRNFPEIWKQSLKNTSDQTNLKPEDRRILQMIGDVVGGSDAKTQLNGLALVSQLAGQTLKQAAEEKAQKGKLYRSLGVLSGIGIAVLLL